MRGMRKEQLEAAIVKTTRMLAAKSIKVTQRGTGAYCAWHPVTGAVIAINLPVFPDNPTQEFLDAIQGYLDHEVAHALYTDALALEAAEKASSLNTSPQRKAELHMFGNVVEDVRIEARIPVDFPGAEANLNKLRGYIVDTVWRPVLTKLKAEADAGDAVALSSYKGTALIPYLRGLNGQSICADLTKELGLDATFADLNAAIPDLQSRLKAMKTSKDAFDIAELIMLVNAPPPQETEADPSDQNDQGDGESKQSPKKAPQDKGDDEEQDAEDGPAGSEDPAESETEAGDDAPDADEDEEGDGAAGEEDDDADEGESKDTDGDDGKDGAEEGKGSGESDEDDDCSGEDDDSGAGADQDGDDQAGEDEGKSSKGDGEDKGDDDSEAGDDEGSQGGDGGDQNGNDSQTDNADAGTEGDQGENDGETEDGDDDQKAAPGVGCDLGIDLSEAKDIDGMLEDQLKGMMKNAFDGKYQVSFTNDWDRVEIYDDKGGKAPDVKGIEDRLRPIIQPMQKELQRLIVARSHSYYTPGFRRGRINPAALHRAPTGDDRLFRKKQEAVTNKVAMSLLIDNSGSMGDYGTGGGKITVAMQAAWAFAETLDRLKIASDVLGFTNCCHPDDVDWDVVRDEIDNMVAATGLPSSAIRTSPAYLPIYKGFDEKFGPAQKRRMAHLIANQNIMRSNNDAVAIDYAGKRLMSRDETRKILIVFSDGQPADSVDTACLYASTKANVERLEKMGVEVLGIGIQSDAVKHFYKRFHVLNDVSDLPRFVMSQLKGMLTPGR